MQGAATLPWGEKAKERRRNEPLQANYARTNTNCLSCLVRATFFVYKEDTKLERVNPKGVGMQG